MPSSHTDDGTPVTGEMPRRAFREAPGSAHAVSMSSRTVTVLSREALGKGSLGKHLKEDTQIKQYCCFTSLWHQYSEVLPGSAHWDASQTLSPGSHILAGGHPDLAFYLFLLTTRTEGTVLTLPGIQNGFGKEPSAFFSPVKHAKGELRSSDSHWA